MKEEFILEYEEALTGSPFKQYAMGDGCTNGNGFSSELWIANSDLAAAGLLHPFILALAQGVLPRTAFQKYIAEDAYFLRSFANGYEVAASRVDKAGVPAAKAAAAASQLEQLREGVLEELCVFTRTLGVLYHVLCLNLKTIAMRNGFKPIKVRCISACRR